MKLVLNEMWPARIAQQLRERGFDVVAATEAAWSSRYRGMPDDEVFRCAQDDGRAVVTDNIGDFGPIHRRYEERGEPHHGVVFALWPRFDRNQPAIVGAMVRSLTAFLESVAPEDEGGGRAHYLRRA